MSQPGLANPQASSPQKQRFSVYTMMLIISFISLVTGSIILAYELKQYGPGWPPWSTVEANVSASGK